MIYFSRREALGGNDNDDDDENRLRFMIYELLLSTNMQFERFGVTFYEGFGILYY